jgi:hypothetical protein
MEGCGVCDCTQGAKLMAVGSKHYLPNGKEHKGPIHKDASGKPMSGAKHTASSKFLSHRKPMAAKGKK